jgi:hypothetical protein
LFLAHIFKNSSPSICVSENLKWKKKTLVGNILLESKSKNQKIKNEMILEGFN